MNECITLGELRHEFEKIKDIVSDDTAFIAKALMYDLERRYGKGYLTRKKRQRRGKR